jgi:ATP-dependent helicase/nuclease subunit A
VTDVLTLTDAQWDAVRAVDQHVLVAAAAGTGKTRTVVARVLYLLGVPFRGHRVERPLSLHDIAAITFTNAAAADLKRKLRDGLRAAGRDGEAYEVDSARIGTIHGFCGDILREFALRAGIRAVGRVLTEGESAALVARVASDGLLGAMEENAVPGLRELLAEVSADVVERWVVKLLDESDRLRDYRRMVDSFGPRERTLVTLAAYTLPLLEARLRGRGAVDFDRMIVWTRDLLTEHPAVRRILQRRIRTLIVDEFQDVDPVQSRIADLLGEPVAKRNDTTRLMLVGDPKQSIFRFRRADVTGWHSVERNFAERKLGAVVTLAENFRSVPPILGLVDATIGPLLDTPATGAERQEYEVAYQPLEATRAAPAGPPVVEVLRVPARPEDGRDYGVHETRVMEASAAARRARELHDAGTRWGDMAVLINGWADLAVYQTAFERVGAPTYALRAEGFWNRREVVDMVLALETVRDPSDDRALFGFLRSPFVGVKDETLLAIARRTRRPYWVHRAGVEVNEQALLDRGLAVVEAHSRLRDRVPTAELLDSLLLETGYLAHLALMGEPGRQAIANVRKLVAMARATPEASVGAFLRIINEARRLPVREPDALLHGQEDDVVTITSVHSAKGLEWQVVFWCDLVRVPGGGRRDDILLAREHLMVRDPAWKRHEESAEWKALRDAIGVEEEAEDKRVWYVAMTRAKDRLIVGGVPVSGGRPKTAAAALHTALPADRYRDHRGAEWAVAARTADPAELLLPAPAPRLEPDPADTLPDVPVPLVVPTGRARHSATELLTYARCPTRHWFKYVAMVREPPVDRQSSDFLDAVTRGIVVHDVLEHYEEDADLDVLLDDAIRRLPDDALLPDGFPGLRQRAMLREEVERVARHPDYRAVDDLPSRRRELGFIHLGAGDGHTVGSFDLAALEDAGLVLLDVKTVQGGEQQVRRKAAQFRRQRDVYVAAAEAIGAQNVARFAFQFSRAGVQVSEPISATARRQAAEELEAVFRALQTGAPELTSFPHECRFCGFRAVGWCPGVPLRPEADQLSLGL